MAVAVAEQAEQAEQVNKSFMLLLAFLLLAAPSSAAPFCELCRPTCLRICRRICLQLATLHLREPGCFAPGCPACVCTAGSRIKQNQARDNPGTQYKMLR